MEQRQESYQGFEPHLAPHQPLQYISQQPWDQRKQFSEQPDQQPASAPDDPMAAMVAAAMTGPPPSTSVAGLGGAMGGLTIRAYPPPAPPLAQHPLAAPLHFPRAADLAAAPGPASTITPARTTKPGSLPIPASLHTRDVSRDAAGAYAIPDPMERFAAVNGHQRQRGVMDLHFQSTRTAAQVLEHLLDAELESVRAVADAAAAREGSAPGRPMVWIITGTGHHTDRNTFAKVGALAEFVEGYLVDGGYRFAYGKDPNGYSGAFAVFAR